MYIHRFKLSEKGHENQRVLSVTLGNVESTMSRRTQTLISSEVGYTHRANDILTDTKTSLGVAYIP